jgi:hypothetical protein
MGNKLGYYSEYDEEVMGDQHIQESPHQVQVFGDVTKTGY